MASPFFGKTFTFTQPDGTKFKVKGWGDQHYAVFETLDGFTVVKNPQTGFYEIAQVSDDGTMLEPAPGPVARLDGPRGSIPPGVRINRDAARARGFEGALTRSGRRCDIRREKRKALARAIRSGLGPLMAPPQRHTVGNFVGLCLLIDFSDEPGTITREEVEKFCNDVGYNGFGNKGSVHDYFLENSIGRCRYTNVVAEYYRARHPKSHYTDPAIQQGVRARQLIVEALNHLKTKNFDFSTLTVDNDRFVYAMNVYYAGEVVNNWAEGLWPHAWHLANPVELLPDKKAFDYQFTDMSTQLTLGTFCHENGHMLCDYPDLYDYGGESSGVGTFCLMCAGNNADEKNPVHISAYLKRLSGWANSITAIQHNQRISLNSKTNDFAIHSKTSGEYFIIENRAKSGRDLALPDEGLAIWHVDEDGNNSNEQMTPASHYELSLEQADGKFELESFRHNGDRDDLYGQNIKAFSNATQPSSKWWDGTSSNLGISEISDPGNEISFLAKLFQDDEDVHIVTGESSPNAVIPDDNNVGITDVIVIGEDATISNTKITLDIAHTYVGDLQVTLVTPWGDSVILHKRFQGTSSNDIKVEIDESILQDLVTFKGQSTKGVWTLKIQDLASADTGKLNRWDLEFMTEGSVPGIVELQDAAGIHIPDDIPAGIRRVLSTNASGTLGSIEVTVDITHTWIGDLRILLKSPSGTEIQLHNLSGREADNILKTYTLSTTPDLANLTGETITGDWELHVSDHANQDIGKLNSWGIMIHPTPSPGA